MRKHTRILLTPVWLVRTPTTGQNLHILLKILIIAILSMLFLASCSVTKHLPAGESLYVGAKVKMIPDSIIPKAEVKNIETQLTEFVRPKPNSSIFGFPYKVWFYYLLGEPKKEKGLKYSFRKRFGEPPVLASRSVTNANVKQITLLLNNEGYFRSTATGELVEKDRKSTAVYTATLQQRYYLDSVVFSPNDSTDIGKVFRDTQKGSTLKKGVPYRFEVISAERNRIDNILKSRGFYYFQADYIIAKVDSSKNNHTANLSFEIKPTTSQVARKPYFIRDVHVLSDYGEIILADSSKAQMGEVEFNGLKIKDKTESYRPSIFSQAIGFRRGVRYSNNLQDLSLSRLINLNSNFKFVRNTFQLVPRSDSALLDVFYYLTPLKAKSVGLELTATTKSNNFTGTSLGLSWNNKNTFGGAELLKISAKVGFDFQVSGISSTLGAINNKIYGISAVLTIPRFVLPFFKVNPITNQSLPKTNIGVDYEVNNRSSLYNLTSSRITMGYAWKQNNSIEHALTPISVNLVKAENFSEDFLIDVFRSDNPFAILQALENTIITSSNYVINYTPTLKRNTNHVFSFTGGVEVAGNLASLLSARADTAGTQTLFGVSIAQYARFDADFRYAYSINKSLKIANRFLIGYSIPYGNSKTLPFVKQYTSGGNNSIRAFPARAIGPGSYVSSGDINSQFLGTQTGDIKLELNTELRVKFNKYVNGAFFIDAGNVWLQKSDDYGDGAIFKSDFYKQIAIGTGIGLRLDFSVLVLRFDLATPVRKPFLPEDDRWVLKNFNLKDANWRSENLILNIAVGYPF
ncbi:MAG: BamA/TamA family outer membrane protein [Arcicella sp.]|nr:BamA/TamA family outer membrane protein [Arcicella sp.]